jgi:hypothetical protein
MELGRLEEDIENRRGDSRHDVWRNASKRGSTVGKKWERLRDFEVALALKIWKIWGMPLENSVSYGGLMGDAFGKYGKKKNCS